MTYYDQVGFVKHIRIYIHRLAQVLKQNSKIQNAKYFLVSTTINSEVECTQK